MEIKVSRNEEMRAMRRDGHVLKDIAQVFGVSAGRVWQIVGPGRVKYAKPKPAHKTLEGRFWEKVDKEGPIHPTLGTRCFVWTGSLTGIGYGHITTGSRYDRASHPEICRDREGYSQMEAHRVAWMLKNGKIPDGIDVLHKCDNRSCVNCEHLFLGTAKDNDRDAVAKGRKKHVNGRWAKV